MCVGGRERGEQGEGDQEKERGTSTWASLHHAVPQLDAQPGGQRDVQTSLHV